MSGEEYYQFYVKVTPEESGMVQEAAFGVGYRWAITEKEVQHTEKPYLFFTPTISDITFSTDDEHVPGKAYRCYEVSVPEALHTFGKTKSFLDI